MSKEYILCPVTERCIICDFMDNYIRILYMNDYTHSGLFCCCKCIKSNTAYTHEICDYIGYDHQRCVCIYSVKTFHSIQDNMFVWYIDDIKELFMHYANDDHKNANNLLETFLKDKSIFDTQT